MHKKILLLSGTKQQRDELLVGVKSLLDADVNHVYADILTIEDFPSPELKASYSDLKKRFKMCLLNSRAWIVVNIPADVKSAWQTYVDLAMVENNMTYQFIGLSPDSASRAVNPKGNGFKQFTQVGANDVVELLYPYL